jgi:hypothetical protein
MNIVKQILDKIPDVIDFNFITAKNPATKSFLLDNPSSKDIYYKFHYKQGFQISPIEGILGKHGKQEVVIKVLPQEAEVLISNVKIILDETASKIIKISFISKYPHIKINRSNIDFGNVLIGKSKEMDLIIKNLEKVSANFTIERETNTYIKSQNCFHLKVNSGEIPENCSFLVKILYTPTNPDVFSYESFKIKVSGGNEIIFNCYGKCLSLNTSISSKQVNFESIELGKTNSKVIRVFNDSDTDTFFQFYYSNEGIFSFEPKQGVIKLRSNERISVKFSPRENMTYYDRAFCLFKNHLLVVSILK